MKNAFFQIALRKAAKFVGKPGRLLLLLVQLSSKLREINWKDIDHAAGKQKFLTLGRLAKAYALGHYKSVPWKSMISVTAAILYFVSPIDLISDFIPVIGLTDDLGILLWVYNSLRTEIDKFLLWEKEQFKVQGFKLPH